MNKSLIFFFFLIYYKTASPYWNLRKVSSLLTIYGTSVVCDSYTKHNIFNPSTKNKLQPSQMNLYPSHVPKKPLILPQRQWNYKFQR